MPSTARTTIQCPRCGTQFAATVETLIDASQEPEAKLRLLSGQTNAAQCPQCGTVSAVATPMVYHDAAKELLITYIPMELGLSKDRQEKVIGDLMREVTSKLPQSGMKGYLFRPRSALTMQGLIDQVLQADGVTPEMMEAQRTQMKLVETLIQTPEAQLPAFVQANDARINGEFLQIMTLMAQRMLQEGRPDVAQGIIELQRRVVDLSSYGQELLQQSQAQEEVVQEVANEIQALGPQAQRNDFRALAIRYAGDDERLQALVGLVRPAFDYQFFQELTVTIAQAPAAERATLEGVRDRLVDLTAAIDQQTQMAVQQSAEILQAILTAPDQEAMIRNNLDLIDDTFMAVLTANIQEAERQSNIQSSARLKALYDKIVAILRENMQPELRFINELLVAPSVDQAFALLNAQAGQYGPQLLDMMDAVEQVLESRGEASVLERLAQLRAQAEQVLS